MTRYGTVVGFSGALADEHLVGNEAFGARTGARSWNAQCATGAQASGELTSQSTPALDEQSLVDRLVRDPHGRIIGEIEVQPMGDLLRAPGHRPAAVLASPVTTTNPPNARTCQMRPVKFRHGARETILHVLTERIVDGELRSFRSSRTPIGMPLGRQGTVVQIAAAGCGISAQFPRDRRWR